MQNSSHKYIINILLHLDLTFTFNQSNQQKKKTIGLYEKENSLNWKFLRLYENLIEWNCTYALFFFSWARLISYYIFT